MTSNSNINNNNNNNNNLFDIDFPEIPRSNKFSASSGLSSALENIPDETPSLGMTFGSLLSKISEEVKEPYKLAQDMSSGKKPFDSAELVVSMLEAERKLSLTVRTINDIVKGIKQLEAIQA